MWPELVVLFAIPNAGKRSMKTGARMKAEGLKAGVPDMCLPVARHGFTGLWIEMKQRGNKPTERQTAWAFALRSQGHKVALCYSAEEAINTIREYLSVAA
jgi:hypothetical protein